MTPEKERVLVVVQPDGVQRCLIGEIISRLERRGLKLVGIDIRQLSEAEVRELHSEHSDKVMPELVEFWTSSPIVPMAWEGHDAQRQVRFHVGASDPEEANPGTIRGDLALTIDGNVVYSEGYRSSEDDWLSFFFDESDLEDYSRADEKWLYREI